MIQVGKLDERLVVIGPDINLGVDDLAEGLAELNELLLAALPGQVAHVKHLRRGLRVAELRLTGGGRHGDAGRSATAACAQGGGGEGGKAMWARRSGATEATQQKHAGEKKGTRDRQRGGREGKGGEGEKGGGEEKTRAAGSEREASARRPSTGESQRRAKEQRR